MGARPPIDPCLMQLAHREGDDEVPRYDQRAAQHYPGLRGNVIRTRHLEQCPSLHELREEVNAVIGLF